MVAVGGGHDVGPSVFAERAQGGCVRADIRGHSGNGGGWWIKRGPHMSRSHHLGFTHATLMRRTGSFSSSLSLFLSLPFPFSFFFSFPLLFFFFSYFLLCFPLGFLQHLLPLFGQFRRGQWCEVEVCSGTCVVTSVQMLVEPCRLAGVTGSVDNGGWR